MWIAPLIILIAQHDANDGTRVVRGAVLLKDEAGRQFERASGTLVVRVGSSWPRDRLVPFREGAFEVRLDERTYWIDVFSAWTPLGPARIDAFNQSVSGGESLDLQADLAAPFTLQVLDAESGFPLDCVDVVPPGGREDVRSFLSSLDGAAIEIGPLRGDGFWQESGNGTWTVRAPGRVDGCVTLTSDSPRSMVVYLERAGGLEIVLEHSPSTRHTYVEVESLEMGLVFREHGNLGSAPRLEGLKPGPYRARVVHEFLDYRRVVLAEARVDVLPDAVVSAKLAVAEPPADDTDGPH